MMAKEFSIYILREGVKNNWKKIKKFRSDYYDEKSGYSGYKKCYGNYKGNYC
jgi:hypothetical protein